jgi:DNA-binding SARP family transcriptional activator/DNA-binding beta-propeller fold protein YncE
MPDAAGQEIQGRSFAFRLLGPLEIALDDRTVALPRRKQRLLLTLLLLSSEEVVSTDHLVEHLWGDNPPKAAVGSLQNLVSEVRKLLGSDVVRTRAGGYALGVESASVDLHRFEQLVAARPSAEGAEGRAQRLRKALALWRGPPLVEFASEPFAQVPLARLHELHVIAREELVEAELELGHHVKLVGELEALVAEEPLRERLRAQLMIALYRSGRQAEALAAYHDARRMLADQLGLAPSAELQRLQRAILIQDPALAAPNVAPAIAGVSPSSPGSAVGRRRLRPLPVALAALALVVLAAALAAGALRRSTDDPAVVPNSVAVVDARTNRVVGDVVIGSRPVALAYGEGAVFVANADDHTVSRIDPMLRKVTRSIRVGTDLRDLTTGFGAIWAAEGKDGTLIRIDPQLKRVKRLHLGAASGGAMPAVGLVAAGAGSVWAIRGDTLFQIDPATNGVVRRIRIPPATGLTAGLGGAWVVTDDQSLLHVGSKRSAKPVVKARLSHRALAPTVGAGSVWLIVRHETGDIWRIDPDSGAVNPIEDAGRYPLDLAVEDNGYVWVVDSTGAVIRINPNIELAAAEIRPVPAIEAAIAVGGGFVWIAVQD